MKFYRAMGAAMMAGILAGCGGTVHPQPRSGRAGQLKNDDSANVLQHHKSSSRNGTYIDPLITRGSVSNTHRDASFDATVPGQVYGQLLFVENGPGGRPVLIAASENNAVVAIDAADGSQVWENDLEPPALRAQYMCGNITPNIGVTGTPVVDLDARVIYVAADATDGIAPHHKVFALSIDDGSLVPGWPIDFSGATIDGATFDSRVHNQRGALLLSAGILYVSYGGHFGDCLNYRGWVFAVPVNNPTPASAFVTTALRGGGIWAPAGVSSDGSWIYAATFNTFGQWMRGEAVFKLGPGATFSGDTADYFAPANWLSLDGSDADLGGTAPIPIDVAGAIPSELLVSIGKTGFAYVLDRNNLGGIGGELTSARVANSIVINAPAAFTAASGTYVVTASSGQFADCPAGFGNLVAFQIGPTEPPSIWLAWCASIPGRAGPIVTTTDGFSDPVVWTVAIAGQSRLRAYDAETGEALFDGGGSNEGMGMVRPFQTPIVANGRIYAVSDSPSLPGQSQIFAFTNQ